MLVIEQEGVILDIKVDNEPDDDYKNVIHISTSPRFVERLLRLFGVIPPAEKTQEHDTEEATPPKQTIHQKLGTGRNQRPPATHKLHTDPKGKLTKEERKKNAVTAIKKHVKQFKGDDPRAIELIQGDLTPGVFTKIRNLGIERIGTFQDMPFADIAWGVFEGDYAGATKLGDLLQRKGIAVKKSHKGPMRGSKKASTGGSTAASSTVSQKSLTITKSSPISAIPGLIGNDIAELRVHYTTVGELDEISVDDLEMIFPDDNQCDRVLNAIRMAGITVKVRTRRPNTADEQDGPSSLTQEEQAVLDNIGTDSEDEGATGPDD